MRGTMTSSHSHRNEIRSAERQEKTSIKQLKKQTNSNLNTQRADLIRNPESRFDS